MTYYSEFVKTISVLPGSEIESKPKHSGKFSLLINLKYPIQKCIVTHLKFEKPN